MQCDAEGESRSVQYSDILVSASDLLCVYAQFIMLVFKHREAVQWNWCDFGWLYRGAGGDGCGEREEKDRV
jgi:hypothetical protein